MPSNPTSPPEWAMEAWRAAFAASGATRVEDSQAAATELARLCVCRDALEAAVRAAELALFVIRKQGIMPNSSWSAGFERDMKTARQALGASNAK